MQNQTEQSWRKKAEKGLNILARCRFEDFHKFQNPPWRSLNSGATGIAYTFWKAACQWDDPWWLGNARLWIDKIADSPRDDSSIKLPEMKDGPIHIEIEDSLYHGNRGVHLVQALVACSQTDLPVYRRSRDELTSPPRRYLEIQDLLQGLPGLLMGYSLLYHHTGDKCIMERGKHLYRKLLDTAGRAPGETPWGNNHFMGIAHGRGGIYYALLFWARLTGTPIPSWIKEQVIRHARAGVEEEHGIRWPIHDRGNQHFMDSWCHGAPGLLHLWALAYRLFRDDFFLETARRTGDYLICRKDYRLGHICCGAAGASYALLTLHGADPEGPWLEYARRFALMAERGGLIHNYSLSLYSGLAGIVCLMLDMANPEEAAQPVFQG